MPGHDSGVPVELQLSRLGWRLDVLEEELEAVRKRQDRLATTVETLTVEDKISQGVKAALEERSRAQAERNASATAQRVSEVGAPILLTWPQKVGGLVAGAILIFDAVKGLY